MDAKLVLVRKGGKRVVVRLKKLPMTLGRGREADLTIAHPMVSRLHCELYEADGQLCVRDLESLNGTFVGDVQIDEALLESGDELTVGNAKFQVVIDQQAEAGEESEAVTVTTGEETSDEEDSVIEAADFEELAGAEFEQIEEQASEPFEAEDVEELAEGEEEEEEEEVAGVEEEAAAEGEEEPEEEESEEEEPEEEESEEEEPAEEEAFNPFAPSAPDEEEDEEEARTQGKIDLGIPSDEAEDVDSEDDDLQDFLAGLK